MTLIVLPNEYVLDWTMFLRHVVGWPEQQIAEFVRYRRLSVIEQGEVDALRHETPAHYVSQFAIPLVCWQQLATAPTVEGIEDFLSLGVEIEFTVDRFSGAIADNSGRIIEQITELIGPDLSVPGRDDAEEFWGAYKDQYMIDTIIHGTGGKRTFRPLS